MKLSTRLLTTLVLGSLLFSQPAYAQLSAQLVVSGLSSPVAFVQDPSQPAVQLIVEQGGRIRVLQHGALLGTDFLDLTGVITSGGERGLLGLAFAPDYATSRRFYVNFTDLAGNTVIARFLRAAGDPLRADLASRFDLVWPDGRAYIEQPFANHNGGDLAFGPDGYLYIPLGDGGSADDPFNNAQSPATLLGKMLRIDVSVPLTDPRGYVVPATNPFVGQAEVLPEIWAFGYRNPWRFSFDDPARGGTGAMIVGDVGQGAREEIDYEPAAQGGRNYGWSIREGTFPNVTSRAPFSLPLIEPIYDYGRGEGRAVSGGRIYRGTSLGSTAVGRYFFADIVTSRVWSLGLTIDAGSGSASVNDVAEHSAELGPAAVAVSSFGVDSTGELYTVNYGTGAIYRLTPAAAAGCASVQPAPDWVCVNGGWLPPGLASAAPPPPPPPPSSPGPTTGCTTVQPAADWVCVNGGWVPPGLVPPSTPPPTTPPPTTPPSPPVTGCTTVQPAPDWICVNGGWLPPGLAPSTGTPPPTPPPTPPTTTGCNTPDPFFGIPGLVGLCVSGGWIPTELIDSSATVEFNPIELGFWAVRLADGRVFATLNDPPDAFKIQGLRVTITGRVRLDLVSPKGPIIELLQIR